MTYTMLRERPRLLRLRTLVATLSLQFTFGLSYAWGAIAPYVRQAAHWSPIALGLGFAAVPVGYATGVTIGGRLADHLPPRRLCWSGIGLLAVGLALGLLRPAAPVLIVAYAGVGLGVGGGLALAGSLAANAQVFPRRIGVVGGALTGVYASAAVVQAPLISRLAANQGWLRALRIVGGGLWLLAAAALLLLPALPRPARLRPTAAGFTDVVRRPRIWRAIVLQFSIAPLGSYATSHIALYARDIGLAAWVGAVAVAALAAGNGLGRLAGGVLSDRAGVDRVVVGIVAVDLGAAVLLSQTRSTLLLLVAAAGLGLAFGAQVGLLARQASRGAPETPHTAFGLLFAAFALGAFAGAVLGPLLGGGRLAWLLLSATTLLSLGASLRRPALQLVSQRR